MGVEGGRGGGELRIMIFLPSHRQGFDWCSEPSEEASSLSGETYIILHS